MEEEMCYDILRIVFKYLPRKDLYNAAQVCRYWAEVANDENFSRGPVYYHLINDSFIDNSTYCIQEFLEEDLLRMSNFQMFLLFQDTVKYFFENCPSNYLSPNCYLLTLEIFDMLDCNDFIMNISFPDSYRLQINTFTFLKIPGSKFVFCPELRFLSGPIFEPSLHMKIDFERYFDDNSPMKSCMILLSDLDNIYLLERLLRSLENWFPYSKISIWGGIAKRIFNCKNFMCKEAVDCILFFISSRNLKTWSTTLPAEHVTKEIVEARLKELKRSIKLQKHSVGLIYITGFRIPDSYFLEFNLFSKIFPEVPYIYIYGPAAFVGEGFKVLLTKLSDLKSLWADGPKILCDAETSIMILTYN